MKNKLILLFIIMSITMNLNIRSQAFERTLADLYIDAISYDIYDFMSWNDMKRSVRINDQSNDSTLYTNFFLTEEEMFLEFEKEQPKFAVLWLRFRLISQCDGVEIKNMHFCFNGMSKGILCKTSSNHFSLGTNYTDKLQEEEIEDSLLLAIPLDENADWHEYIDKVLKENMLRCHVDYTINESELIGVDLVVELHSVKRDVMYCSNGMMFCVSNVEMLSSTKLFASEVISVKDAWTTLPEKVYLDLQTNPEKYKLVRLSVTATKKMPWNAYRLKYGLIESNNNIWLKTWNQSSSDMIYAYDTDDICQNGTFEREMMLLIRYDDIMLPIDELIELLEFRVMSSTEIVGDDGGTTMCGPRFSERVSYKLNEH